MRHARPTSSGRPGARARARGFSFMELVIVMGAMAMLMGLAVGYLGNVGQATLLAQARAILSETAYRCVNGSTGGRRAILTLRRGEDAEGLPMLLVGAALARPVLTHQFETLDHASEARQPVVRDKVELKRGGGRVGNCASFQGGYLELGAQSVFAMTEGLELDVWLKPAPRQRMMSIVRGGESYEVLLIQAGNSDAYDVRLQVKSREVDEERRTLAEDVQFETSGGPLSADGRWCRLQVDYDAALHRVQIRVNGLGVYDNREDQPAPSDPLVPAERKKARRIVVGEGGAIALTISSSHAPYYGEMDAFQLRGVFRSEELEREIPGDLEVITPPEKDLPVQIEFANGGLDPDRHDRDQVLRFRDKANPGDRPLRLTLGMYGSISARYEKEGEDAGSAPPPPAEDSP